MRVKHKFVATLPEGTNPLKVKSSNWNDDLDIYNPPSISTADYNFEAQFPGGLLTAGITNSITLSPVPKGVNGTNANHYLLISGGSGTQEAVLITGGTAVSEADSGTLTFIPAYNHSGAWQISSATAGCQEAIRGNTQNKLIKFPIGEVATYAPINVDVEHSRISGSGDSSIRNEVGVMFNITAGFVEISHLCLIGLRTAGSIGIQCSGIQCYLHHLKMLTFDGAIRIHGGFHTMISYIFSRNMLTYGILLEDGVGHTVSFFSIATDTGVFEGPTTAGIIVRTEGCMLSHLDILHPNAGILIQPISRHIEWLHVDFSYIDNCISHCILIQNNSATWYVRGLVFERIWMATSGYASNSTIGHGLFIEGTGDIHTLEFVNCWIHNHYDDAVKIFKGTDLRFVNCRFMGGNAEGDTGQDLVYSETTGTIDFIECEFGNSQLWTEVHRAYLTFGATAGRANIKNCKFDTTIASGSRLQNFASTPENIRNFGFNEGLDNDYQSIPSASIITTQVGFSYNLTGNTNIDNIFPIWEDRKMRLRNAGSGNITLNTGANIKNSITLAVGETCKAEFIYDKWLLYKG